MSNDVGRRGFLQGLIGSIAAGTVIVKASDEDIARYGTKVGDSVIAQHGQLETIPKPKWGTDFSEAVKRGAMPGGMWMLYNSQGEAVAAVKNYTMDAPIDGLVTADIHCVPINARGIEWLQDMGVRETRLRMEGRK